MSKCLVTHQTRVRSFVAVCSLVIRKRTGLTKGLVTHVTLIRSLSAVGSFVVCQSDILPEGFTTQVANEGSFFCMSSAVTYKSSSPTKCLVTDVTVVWTGCCVNPFMFGEFILSIKSLPT